ncbi:MAG: cob(I)yrinic acid a,c-diamide adenosyltransferase [Proteobacteria bacterium]|jgi:cob(I)alamin adenosyltransferase|nr:cob(I)yrinic acid a,c-diamide adenosyltransferase [Pseudomonadota bacterium]
MKIYTKIGDQGKTKLVGGTSVDKFDPRLEAYGTLDELNSFLSVALEQLNEPLLSPLRKTLTQVQHQLFNLGSHLACEDETFRPHLPALKESWIEALETSIDAMTAELPPLKNFILPGGNPASTWLHVCRTVCRRGERRIANLPLDESTYAFCLKYCNRLSDHLFTSARWVNFKTSKPEVIWDKNAT